jgi:HEPN domain-containing protein
MSNRAPDWLKQAQRDYEQATASQRDGRHEWACFAAHQAAGKALKALHLNHGQEACGHVVAQPLRELPDTVDAPDEVVERARALDNLYIPTRYPNSHPAGAPFEHYGPLQSQQAVEYAGQILAFVRSSMA